MPRAAAQQHDDDMPLYFGLTPNQVVAYNLALARDDKGWTQEQTCEVLEPHLGVRWSKANYSAAERSVDGVRVRNFTADEIVAFARGFERPVTWFFMPPPPWVSPGVPAKLETPDARPFGRPLALLADLVFGTDDNRAVLELRLQSFLDQLGSNPLSEAQHRIKQLVESRKTQLVRHAVSDLSEWQTKLRALASQLEDLENRVSTQVENEFEQSP